MPLSYVHHRPLGPVFSRGENGSESETEHFVFRVREGFRISKCLTPDGRPEEGLRADRAHDMRSATTSGIGSKTFCLAAKGMWAARRRTFVEAVLFRFRAGTPWRDLARSNETLL